jgi:hypothetical protein
VFFFSDKIPASKVLKETKNAVSPVSSPTSSNDELMALRARNKVLTDALTAIKESASKEMKKSYDLVWFARYRCKYSAMVLEC